MTAGQPHVLIVDDDPSVRASLVAYLQDEGFTVYAAHQVDEVLAIFRNHPIGVAIVDIRLGEIGGEALILQAHRLRPMTHFMIFTGSVSYKPPEPLQQIGVLASQVFHKPLRTLKVLADEIRRVSSRKEQPHAGQDQASDSGR